MSIDTNKLTTIVAKLMHHHKGILAADESNTSCNKRFAEYGIAGTEENRRRYRELLLTTDNIEQYVSGVILFDETIRQMTNDGQLFRDVLKHKGILVGIKVDEGLVPLSSGSKEMTTKGLETLASRLRDYQEMNAVFTKWRSVFVVETGFPTKEALKRNCLDMAQYAKIVQEKGMVPIVEPEVLIEGTHTIDMARETTELVLGTLIDTLEEEGVYLGGCIVKTSMVVAGKESSSQASHEQVAEKTSTVLRKTLPSHLGGVVFLSGGQSPQYALHNLNEIASLGPYPWPVTFSFSRALQAPALDVWRGVDSHKSRAQKIFEETLMHNSLARQGKLEFASHYTSRHHGRSLRGFFVALAVLITILLLFV